MDIENYGLIIVTPETPGYEPDDAGILALQYNGEFEADCGDVRRYDTYGLPDALRYVVAGVTGIKFDDVDVRRHPYSTNWFAVGPDGTTYRVTQTPEGTSWTFTAEAPDA